MAGLVGSRGSGSSGLWLVMALCTGCGACRAHSGTGEESSPEPARARQAGLFVWHELVASDPEVEAAFYEDVVGWRATRDAEDHLTLIGDFGEVAGVSRLPPELKAQGLTPRWMARVAVEDVDATIAKTRLHGGQVALEPMDVPDGRFAILEDPAGTSLQIASARKPKPLGDHGRPSEFSWDELSTPDGPGMLEFYGEVLGWKILLSTPMGDRIEYVTLGRGDTPMAGVFVDPSLRQQQWHSYVQVRDLDRALSRAAARGAVLLAGPKEVPDGRMALLEDQEGAIIGLRESSKQDAR